MQQPDLFYICRTFGNLCGIPVRLFQGEEEVFKVDHSGMKYDPLLPYRNDLFSFSAHADTYITPMYFFFGLVRKDETRIILGPARQMPATDLQLREYAFLCNVPSEDVQEFTQAIRNLTPMPLENIQQILCAMNYILNQEKLSLEDIALSASQESHPSQFPSFAQKSSEMTGNPHNTLGVEETIMNMVSIGDLEGLKAWIASAPAIHAGPMAHEELRQYKNTFIVSTTLAARSAIRGGMDEQDALSTSDLLIRNCEALQDVQSIVRLQAFMMINYTEQVQKLRSGISNTPLAISVASWVQKHINEPVSTESLAMSLHISRPHLARKFKKETGMTLTDYILKKKCEKASSLLTCSDKEIIAISEYLGFSSQSHFARVFEKYMKTSPGKYRSAARKALKDPVSSFYRNSTQE